MREQVTRWCRRLIEAAIGPIKTDITDLQGDVAALQAAQVNTNTNLSTINAKNAAGSNGVNVAVTVGPLIPLFSQPMTYSDVSANAARLSFILHPQTISSTANVTFGITRNGVNIQNLTLDIDAYRLTLGFCPVEWYFWRSPAPYNNTVYCAPRVADPVTGVMEWRTFSNAPLASGTTLWGLECSPLSNTGEVFSVTGIAWETMVAVPLL